MARSSKEIEEGRGATTDSLSTPQPELDKRKSSSKTSVWGRISFALATAFSALGKKQNPLATPSSQGRRTPSPLPLTHRVAGRQAATLPFIKGVERPGRGARAWDARPVTLDAPGHGMPTDSLSTPQPKSPSPQAPTANPTPTQPQHAPPAANANYVTIPDANFRACLKRIVPNAFSGDQIDTDHPSVRGLTAMDVDSKHIQSLEGIAYFTALTYLECYDNPLTALDVSHNTALKHLGCRSNQLTNLDLSRNKALTHLECYSNQLTSLDVSHNTALTRLDCGDNQLTSLDVSANTALTHLECYSNQLTSLDVRSNTALTGLYCRSNQLTNLDLSRNKALTVLGCQSNQLTSLDLSQNTALTELYCSNNQLIELDLRGIKAFNTLDIYRDGDTTKSLKTLRLNGALKDHAQVQKVKEIRGNSVRISTYTDLGVLTCYNYNPATKACAVLYGPIHTTKALLDQDAPVYQTDTEARVQCYNDKPLTVYLPKNPAPSRSMVICTFKNPVTIAVPKDTDQQLSYKGKTTKQLPLTTPARPYGFHWDGTTWQVQ